MVSANYGGGSDLSDANGYYSLPVPWGWIRGTVTVEKARWTFTPDLRRYRGPITVDQVDQDYAGRAWADFDLSGLVDLIDLAILGQHWVQADCPATVDCDHTDLDLSGKIDMMDWSLFAPRWGQEN